MTVLKLTPDGLTTGHDVGDEELNRGVASDAERRIAVIQEVADQVTKIRTDPGLNDGGKAERLRAWIQRNSYTLRRVVNDTAVSGLREKAEANRAEALNPRTRLAVPEADSRRQLDAERRINEHLRKLAADKDAGGVHAVLGALRAAAEANDLDTLRAVEFDPLRRLDPLVPDDKLQEIRSLHAQTRSPELWTKAQAQDRAASVIASNIEAAGERLSEVTRGAWPPAESEGDSFTILGADRTA